MYVVIHAMCKVHHQKELFSLIHCRIVLLFKQSEAVFVKLLCQFLLFIIIKIIIIYHLNQFNNPLGEIVVSAAAHRGYRYYGVFE